MPAEKHEHFDADGNYTGYTVVTRDPEWTDRDREHVQALADVKASECPKCGGKLHETTDEHVAWLVEHDVCNRCETIAYTQALADGASKTDAEKQAAPAGRLWRATAVPQPKP